MKKVNKDYKKTHKGTLHAPTLTHSVQSENQSPPQDIKTPGWWYFILCTLQEYSLCVYIYPRNVYRSK